MATLLLDPPAQGSALRFPESQRGARLGADRRGGEGHEGSVRAHGRSTLDELLTGVWEDLAVRAVVHCPVCGGRMAAHQDSHESRHGACLDCGSRLT